MADADEVWLGIERAPSVRYSALVPNLRGARRALDRGLTEIEAVVSASDTHNRKNVNRSTEESLDDIAVASTTPPRAAPPARSAGRTPRAAPAQAACRGCGATWR